MKQKASGASVAITIQRPHNYCSVNKPDIRTYCLEGEGIKDIFMTFRRWQDLGSIWEADCMYKNRPEAKLNALIV